MTRTELEKLLREVPGDAEVVIEVQLPCGDMVGSWRQVEWRTLVGVKSDLFGEGAVVLLCGEVKP